MVRRPPVPRHDDFLSESDLSASSNEDATPARARASPVSSTRRPYLDDVARGEEGYAAARALASSSEGSSDEDEEKLIGGGGRPRVAGTQKSKKRRWEMRSGPGAAAPTTQGTTPANDSHVGWIITGIVFFVLLVGCAGAYYAYSQGMFDSSSGSSSTGTTSASASRTTAGASAGMTSRATSGASGAASQVSSSSDSDDSSVSTSGSASLSVSSSSGAKPSASSDGAGTGAYKLETVTTTDDAGETVTLTGFESLATEGGATFTTIVEADAAPTSGAGAGGHHSTIGEDGDGDGDGDEGDENGLTDKDATETGAHTLPSATKTLAKTDKDMHTESDERRRRAYGPWPAPTAPPVLPGRA
ncbi:hypothetical protein JCM3770_004238 [Rhodotorula araucariae]